MDRLTYVYLLVIDPNGTVEQKSNEVKYIFRHDYNCIEAGNKPHITLAQFVLVGKQMEDRILKHFRRFFSLRKSFDVEIDGLGRFDAHTIFLNVVTKAVIVKIVKGIRDKFRKYLMPDSAFPPFFSLTPHLTIARGMQEHQFEKAWPAWQDHKFSANFKVDEVVLIKRPYPGIDRYEEVERFSLKGLGEDCEQLKLPF